MFILLIATIDKAFSIDITTSRGQTFRDCHIHSVKLEGVYITLNNQNRLIEFHDLPPVLQDVFHYDPKKGKIDPQRAAQDAYQACQLDNEQIKARVRAENKRLALEQEKREREIAAKKVIEQENREREIAAKKVIEQENREREIAAKRVIEQENKEREIAARRALEEKDLLSRNSAIAMLPQSPIVLSPTEHVREELPVYSNSPSVNITSDIPRSTATTSEYTSRISAEDFTSIHDAVRDFSLAQSVVHVDGYSRGSYQVMPYDRNPPGGSTFNDNLKAEEWALFAAFGAVVLDYGLQKYEDWTKPNKNHE